MRFHAVMIDETGCEFGVDFDAENHDAAIEYLSGMYPESVCDQLETQVEANRREKAMYDHIMNGGDWDDEGRPIFHR